MYVILAHFVNYLLSKKKLFLYLMKIYNNVKNNVNF